jgi:hypothetical protein
MRPHKPWGPQSEYPTPEFKVRITLVVCTRDAWNTLLSIQRHNDIWTSVKSTCGSSLLSPNGSLKTRTTLTDVNVWSATCDPNDIWSYATSKWTLLDYNEVSAGLMYSDNATQVCIMSILLEYHRGSDAYLKKLLDVAYSSLCNAKDTLDFAPIVIRVPPLQMTSVAEHLKSRLDVCVTSIIAEGASQLHEKIKSLQSALPFSSCLFP